jgi:hypothetical protein
VLRAAGVRAYKGADGTEVAFWTASDPVPRRAPVEVQATPERTPAQQDAELRALRANADLRHVRGVRKKPVDNP